MAQKALLQGWNKIVDPWIPQMYKHTNWYSFVKFKFTPAPFSFFVPPVKCTRSLQISIKIILYVNLESINMIYHELKKSLTDFYFFHNYIYRIIIKEKYIILEKVYYKTSTITGMKFELIHGRSCEVYFPSLLLVVTGMRARVQSNWQQ